MTIQADLTTEASAKFIRRIQNDPALHIEKVQGVATLESYQRRIAQAIVDHDRVAIAACHDVGKTWTMSKIVLWFGSSFPGCKIITTAPTFNQVKRLLWAEIRAGWRKSRYPLGGEMLQTEWKISDDWFALGFTSRVEASSEEGQGTASSFQGFHGRYVLVVFDEATGVPPQIWKQAEGLLTSGHVKFVAIGNPTSPSSDFAKCFKSPAWHKIRLSCFDSPNLPANGIHNLEDLRREVEYVQTLSDEDAQARMKSYKIVQPFLLSLSWVVAMAIEWGMDHPLFVSKVLGQFPAEGSNVMIPLAAVEAAQARFENRMDPETTKPTDPPTLRTYGIDPARFGSDKTVISVLDGTLQTHRKVCTKFKTTEVTGEVIALFNSLPRRKREVIVVDGTGLGAGIVDELTEAQQLKILPATVEILEANFGGGCDDPEDKKHFANLKAQMFRFLADDLRTELAIMPESLYLKQLPTIQYKFTSKGQLIIESKDDYNKRTGMSSPDDADSLALANFGRHDQAKVGRFSKNMLTKNQGAGTIAGSIEEGGKW